MELNLHPIATKCFVSGRDFAENDRIACYLAREASGEVIRRDLLEVVGRLAGEVDKVLLDDPAHSVDRAIHGFHLAEFPRFECDPDDALIDYRRWPAALRHQHFAFKSAHKPEILASELAVAQAIFAFEAKNPRFPNNFLTGIMRGVRGSPASRPGQ